MDIGTITLNTGHTYRLSAITVAAIEDATAKCAIDGRSFLLRIFDQATNVAFEQTVSPATPLEFSYDTSKPTKLEYAEQAALVLDAIILEGPVTVVANAE